MKSNWNKFHKILKIGIILLLFGAGPLLITIGLDKTGIINAGNALGPGLLAMISFWPSIILIIIGIILTYQKRKAIE